MPPTPHLVQGKVTNYLGKEISEASVLITIPNGSSTVNTDSSGNYAFNIAGIGEWNEGDSFSVYGYKEKEGEKTESSTLTSNPFQTINLVLTQEDKYEAAVPTAAIGFTKVLLSDYEGKNYGGHYPLPIKSGSVSGVNVSNAPLTTAIEYNSNGTQKYIGYSVPGTGKSVAGWLIQLLSYNSSMQVVDIQFASSSFDQVWDDRGSLVYK